MKKKTWHSFVKSHNLVNRIYDMLDYFHCFDEVKNIELRCNLIDLINDLDYLKQYLYK